MTEPKTRPTDASVEAFIEGAEPEARRADGFELLAMMRELTGEEPEMWGPTIVGFGRAPVTYADGSTRDWMRIGFSPRRAKLSLYGLTGCEGADALLERLGPHKTGAACLYVTRLDRIDREVLRELIARAWEHSADGGS